MAFCPQCGAPLATEAAFCSACGASSGSAAPLAPASLAAPAAAPVVATGAPAPAVRPVGVTIVGIGTIVLSALGALGVAAMLLMGMFFLIFGMGTAAAFDFEPFDSFAGGFGAAMFALFFVLALVAAVFVGLGIATGLGVLRGRSWAWPLMLIFMGLWILGGLSSLADQDFGGVFSILIGGLVIWYFFQPEVKTWFGRT